MRRIDHSSRGVLSTVSRRCVWSRNLENEEAKARYRAVKIQPQWVVKPRKQTTNIIQCILSVPNTMYSINANCIKYIRKRHTKKPNFFNSGKTGTHGRQAKWGGRVTTGKSKAWCKDKQQEVASEAVARCIRLLSDLGTRSSQRLLLKNRPPCQGCPISFNSGPQIVRQQAT